eukprot:g5419.t1
MDLLLANQSVMLSEFVGTFTFLGSILAAVRNGDSVTLKLSLGLVVAATVSGAHMNPAVSAMFHLKDGGNTSVLALRVLAQLAGALVTLKAYQWMGNDNYNGKSKKARDDTAYLAEKVLAEFVGSVLFFSAILLSAGDNMKVGLGLYAAANLVGDVSGGHLNPAVTVMFLVKNSGSAAKAGMYVGSQLVAGAAALRLVAVLQN